MEIQIDQITLKRRIGLNWLRTIKSTDETVIIRLYLVVNVCWRTGSIKRTVSVTHKNCVYLAS